ncbi:MAG: undecaprenyl-diphosphate phosphatase [Clostridia bacterium]|nr:undecaprenyl-diphosphate phosphatase [Clostridia bacterium]
MWIEILKAILFGIVEGITEWLPISSTGHLILVEQFVKLQEVSPEFWGMFQVVIQFGAILAVVLLYWNKIWPITVNKKDAIQSKGILSYLNKDIMILWSKILVACIPAGVIGIFFDETFEALFYNPFCIAIALIVFGIGFIGVENFNRKRKSDKVKEKNSQITYKDAIIIGFFQLLAAIFPGTSRSGATIIGGLLIGLSRPNIAEFTFYLAIPTMLGASLLKLVKFGFAFTGMELMILLVGMVVSFFVSVLVIKFLMNYIKKHDFKPFGYYRIALGIIVLAYFCLMKG